MSNRYLILLMSTLLLVEVVTSKSTEIPDEDDILCNNPVTDWVRIQMLEMKNELVDGFLRIFKSYLDNTRESLSSTTERPVKFKEDVAKFVRKVETAKSGGAAFGSREAINEAAHLVERTSDFEDADNLLRSSFDRMVETVRQFGVNFDKFAATKSSEERGRYEALFAFQRKFNSEQDVKNKFHYLDELDQQCTK